MAFLGFGSPDAGSPLSMGSYNTKAATGAGGVQKSAGPDLSGDAQFRSGQMQLANQLRAQAAGGGPNPAGMQMAQGMAQNASNAMALAASGRANNPGMAGYYASRGIGDANQSAANAAGVARMNQMLGAQQNLAGVLGQGRSADLTGAQMGMQNNQFNAGQFNNQLGADVAAQNALNLNQNNQIYGNDQAQQDAQRRLFMSLLSGVGSGAQSAATGGMGGPGLLGAAAGA